MNIIDLKFLFGVISIGMVQLKVFGEFIYFIIE